MDLSKDNRVSWADALRILAMFAVIIQHYCPSLYNSNEADMLYANILVSSTDWCVPVFIMLSGMFLLSPDKQWDTQIFFKKNVCRIVCALCFWSIIYGLFYFITNNGNGTIFSIIGPIFWKRLPWYHLWFVYMILGLYLLTPVLRIYIYNASNKNIGYFLLLCFLVSLIDTWNSFFPKLNFTIPQLTGFVGYYVLGYYLTTIKLSKWQRRVVYLISITCCIALFALNNILNIEPHSIFGFTSPLVAISSIGVMIFARYHFSYIKGVKLTKLSSLMFGVYLIHDLFIQILPHEQFCTVGWIEIFVRASITFLLSLSVIYIISKIPIARKYII